MLAYKDYYDDILSGKMKSIYAFYGPEKFIMNSMIDISKKRFIAEGLESIDLIDFEAKNLTYTEARKLLEHLPFASEKRLLIMRNPDFIDSDKWDRKNLDAFLDFHHQSDHLLTLLIFDKIDNRKYGVKAISKLGKVVEFSRINRDELIRWIHTKFRELKKEIQRDALIYIADNSMYLEKNADSDLGKLYSFIQVLADSIKSDRISLKDVRSLMASKYDSNVFKWRSAILSGKAEESIYYLHALFLEGEAPIKLLYMLENQLRDLYLYSLLKSANLKDAEIAKKMGKQVFMLKDLNILYHSPTFKNINHIIELLLAFDDMMKIGGVDGKLLLQYLAFKIKEIRNERILQRL